MLEALKNVLLSFSVGHSLYESMMSYDFKIRDAKTSLMQLCFSHLASWPLFIMVIIIYINPFKYSFTVQNLFGSESQISFFLLDGHLSPMAICFSVLFLIEWIFRKQALLTLLIFFMLAQSDLHIHLAVACVLGIYLSWYCHNWWFHIDLESQTKKIWQKVTNLQLLTWLIVSVGALTSLNYLQFNQFFAASLSENRYQFLVLIIFSFHALAFIFSAIWGHFFFRRQIEPSFLPIYYSTAKWILRIKLSNHFKNLLQQRVKSVLTDHQQARAQFQTVKDQSLGIERSPLINTLNKEIGLLEEASSRLTIE